MAALLAPPGTDVPPETDVSPETAGALEAIYGLVPLLAAAIRSLGPSLRPLAMQVVQANVALENAHYEEVTKQRPAPAAQPAASTNPSWITVTRQRTRERARPNQRRSHPSNRQQRRLADPKVQERARARQARTLSTANHSSPAVPAAAANTSRGALATGPCASAVHERLDTPPAPPGPPVQTLTPLNAASQAFTPRAQKHAPPPTPTTLQSADHTAMAGASESEEALPTCCKATPMSVSASPEAEAAPGPTSESWRETRSTLKMDPVVPEKAPPLRWNSESSAETQAHAQAQDMTIAEMQAAIQAQNQMNAQTIATLMGMSQKRLKVKPEQGQT